MPATQRPPPVTRADEPEPIPLLELVRLRRERADRMHREREEREAAERLAEKPIGGHG